MHPGEGGENGQLRKKGRDDARSEKYLQEARMSYTTSGKGLGFHQKKEEGNWGEITPIIVPKGEPKGSNRPILTNSSLSRFRRKKKKKQFGRKAKKEGNRQRGGRISGTCSRKDFGEGRQLT